MELATTALFAAQKFVEIGHGRQIRKVRFAQIDLIAILNCSQQLDALQGTEAQIFCQIGIRCEFGRGSPGDSGNKLSERAGGGVVPSLASARAHAKQNLIANYVALRFTRGRAWKILFRPDEPVPHMLIFGKSFVGARDRGLRIEVGLAQDKDGARLCIAAAVHADDHAIAHLGLSLQGRFQILRIDVHPGWRDDDFFLASFEKEIAFSVEFSEVAG